MRLLSGVQRRDMTTNEAKKDLAKKLSDLNIPYTKLTAKTVGFQDLCRCDAVFVAVHGAVWRKDANIGIIKNSMTLKPSEGGYIPEQGKDCKWE